jgi:LemA protein
MSPGIIAINAVLGAISIGIIAAGTIHWVKSSRRRLAGLDENVNNAMLQIGVQLSARYYFLTALLETIKENAAQESGAITLIKTIESKRSDITAKSTSKDLQDQENIISWALGAVALISEKYPELKENENCIKSLDAVETYERMIRASRLAYNLSITNLNHEIQKFPVSLIAGRLGFSQRGYI